MTAMPAARSPRNAADNRAAKGDGLLEAQFWLLMDVTLNARRDLFYLMAGTAVPFYLIGMAADVFSRDYVLGTAAFLLFLFGLIGLVPSLRVREAIALHPEYAIEFMRNYEVTTTKAFASDLLKFLKARKRTRAHRESWEKVLVFEQWFAFMSRHFMLTLGVALAAMIAITWAASAIMDLILR